MYDLTMLNPATVSLNDWTEFINAKKIHCQRLTERLFRWVNEHYNSVSQVLHSPPSSSSNTLSLVYWTTPNKDIYDSGLLFD